MSVFEIVVCTLLGILVVEHSYFNFWHYLRIKEQQKETDGGSAVAWKALTVLMQDLKNRTVKE